MENEPREQELKIINKVWHIYNSASQEWEKTSETEFKTGFVRKKNGNDYVEREIKNGKPVFRENKRRSEKCYNCGEIILEGEYSGEHIPAQCLFEGFEIDHDRIKVSGCRECNSGYSKIDEDFRNLIGIKSENFKNKNVTEKSIRGIFRNLNQNLNRLNFNEFGTFEGMDFERRNLVKFHKKNFKGIFCHEYNKPLTDDYELTIVNIGSNDDFKTKMLVNYLVSHFEWKVSGNEKVFQYIIQPFREIKEARATKEDIAPEEDEFHYVGLMVYNDTEYAVVIASKRNITSKIRAEIKARGEKIKANQKKKEKKKETRRKMTKASKRKNRKKK